jgi:hypothetical protein
MIAIGKNFIYERYLAIVIERFGLITFKKTKNNQKTIPTRNTSPK